MEKLKEGVYALDSLNAKVDGIMGLSFLLWEAITEGGNAVDADIHGGAAFLLHDEITAIHDALHDIGDLLHDGLNKAKT